MSSDVKSMASSSYQNSLSFEQKQSILVFNLKSQYRKLMNEYEEKENII